MALRSLVRVMQKFSGLRPLQWSRLADRLLQEYVARFICQVICCYQVQHAEILEINASLKSDCNLFLEIKYVTRKLCCYICLNIVVSGSKQVFIQIKYDF